MPLEASRIARTSILILDGRATTGTPGRLLGADIIAPLASAVAGSFIRNHPFLLVQFDSCAPGFAMCALVSERAHMGFLGAHGDPGRLRTYRAPGPNPSREAITPRSFLASRNALFWRKGLSAPSKVAARARASTSKTSRGPWAKTSFKNSAASSLE